MNSKTIIRSIVFFVLVFFLLEVAIAQSIISFKDKYGRTLQAEIYEKTGSAKRIFGLNLHISQYGYKRRNLSSETIKQLGEHLIDDYKDVLKITSKSIKLKNVDTDGQWWFVEYEQIVSDIPIYGSEIGFSVDPQGYVVTLGATVHPGVSIKPVPHISP